MSNPFTYPTYGSLTLTGIAFPAISGPAEMFGVVTGASTMCGPTAPTGALTIDLLPCTETPMVFFVQHYYDQEGTEEIAARTAQAGEDLKAIIIRALPDQISRNEISEFELINTLAAKTYVGFTASQTNRNAAQAAFAVQCRERLEAGGSTPSGFVAGVRGLWPVQTAMPSFSYCTVGTVSMGSTLMGLLGTVINAANYSTPIPCSPSIESTYFFTSIKEYLVALSQLLQTEGFVVLEGRWALLTATPLQYYGIKLKRDDVEIEMVIDMTAWAAFCNLRYLA